MNSLKIAAATAVFALAGAAQADLAFSFADPGLGIRPVTNVANGGGPGVGLITYNMAVPISFIVDGSSEPNSFQSTFSNARLELNLAIGSATTFGGVTTANVSGYFIVTDAVSNQVILRGDSQSGSFVRIGGTNSILFSDQTGFAYTFGSALTSLLAPGRTPANPQEAVFTLTNILVAGGGPLIGAGGEINSFSANSSFTGNTAVVPTPGSLALAGLAGLVVARRRRA